jgi:hypothetical protein
MMVMFSFLMVGISVFLGMSINLSQVFQQRAHLQVCADAAAFSGAVQQARGLNRIARMNNEAAEVLKTTRIALHCYIFPDHDAGFRAAMAASIGYRIYNVINLIRQQKVNMDAAKDARSTAELVTRRNDPQAVLSSYTPASVGVGRLIPATGAKTKFGFFYKQATPLGELILYDPGKEVKALVFKKALALDTIYYTSRVSRPFFPWAFKWGREGSRGVRNIRAYATAKPAGGCLWDVKEAVPEYRTKLVRTGSVFPLPSIPDAWGYAW